jgi:uncharacterized lipoprotein YddW (UPF0748 family)
LEIQKNITTFVANFLKMRRLLLLLIYIWVAFQAPAQIQNFNAKPPKYEVRAVWLTTIGGLDWPHSYAQSERSAEKQKQELCNILNRLQQAGINQVLLQTRIRATTIYPSAYEPWDGCLSGFPGKSPGYDALAFAIEECHKRGIELHAWVVTMPVGKWNAMPCKKLRKRFPGLITKIGPDGYMNPEKPQTASYLADICEEIVRNYDVDGIHLDYIRYPEEWKMRVSEDKGRENITNIVKTIHNRIKPLKPYVKFSCSPIGKFSDLTRYWSHGWNAYSRVCQDAQGWLRDGLMDELIPMMYFQGEQFFPFAIDWSENNYGKIIASGLGIYFMSPDEKDWPLEVITREMEISRQFHLGHAYFRSKFFTDNEKGIYDYAANQFDNTLALVPPMTWESNQKPSEPQSLKLIDNQIVWQPASSADKDILYNVYSSRSYPVDISDSRNLIAVKLRKNDISLPMEEEPRYYAVTAINRYGIESDALQQTAPSPSVSGMNLKMLSCDGYRLKLPSRDPQSDADILIIEDLKGKQVALLPWKDKTLDISHIEDGMYQLRSLNSRGIVHRLGFFKIKRGSL